jgi:hypothetical protein
MELIVKDLNVGLSNDNVLRIQERTRSMFNKISDSVKKVKVTLNDINGPRGGRDKNCRVVIQLKGIPDIIITDNQTSVMSAVNRCLSKAKVALVRKVKRKQKLKPIWTQKKLEDGLEKYVD